MLQRAEALRYLLQRALQRRVDGKETGQAHPVGAMALAAAQGEASRAAACRHASPSCLPPLLPTSISRSVMWMLVTKPLPPSWSDDSEVSPRQPTCSKLPHLQGQQGGKRMISAW